MKKYLIMLLVSLFTVSPLLAQNKATIQGTIIDTTSKQSMKDASVSILNKEDSTVEAITLSEKNGSFNLQNLKTGNYLLRISFQGYRDIFRNITITSTQPNINYGKIFMRPVYGDLPGVTVTQSPMTIKNDTIEYNASSFKVKPDAVVEDLLKKLPGIQVDRSGNITAQGESVKRVLVDGKRFFGDDPLMATKNLPPDIVDKIQVFDDQSDQSKFTGFDDGNKVKTINITTKKDKRKGYFGKVAAAAGDKGTYDESFNIHRFNGDQQLSVLGQTNNINKQNFTSRDILGAGLTSGSGINTIWAGGLNLRNQSSQNNQMYGSYFYTWLHNSTQQTSLTQNIVSNDYSTYNNENQSSISKSGNHAITFNWENQIDSNNSFIFRPNVSFQNTDKNVDKYNLYSDTANIYNAHTGTYSKSHGYSLSSDLLLRHKFQKKYRTMSLDLSVSSSDNDGNGKNLSVKDYYTNSGSTDTLDQKSTSNAKSLTLAPTLSYTEPLGAHEILEFKYGYSYTKNTSDKETYDRPMGSIAYDEFDSIYSNIFRNTYNLNTFNLNYRYQFNKLSFSAGGGIQVGDVHSINTTKKTDIRQHYVNFTPNAQMQLNFSKTKNLRIFYRGATSQPSVTNLQPILTTSDSINFTEGNPNLKQQFTHSLRFLYNSFNVITQQILFVTVNASMIQNDIQSSIVYLDKSKGTTLTKPVNLNGTYNFSGFFNYGFPIFRPKSNMNLGTNITYAQSQNLVDSASNYTRNLALGERISWTTNLSNYLDIDLSSQTTYNIARYTLQPKENANYFTQVFSVDATAYTNSGWELTTSFDYTYNGKRTSGYNASIPLLNASIAKQFLKNKQAEIKFSVYDLLNENKSVSRTISSNTIVDSKSNVLTQYFQLTFTYNIRNFFGQKQKLPSFMRGMFRGGDMGGGPGDGKGGGGFGGGGPRG